MSDKHTKGLWWVMKRTSRPLDDYYVLTGKDRITNKPIDIASFNWLLESDEECRANADLIAAAPELLNALEGAVKVLRSGNGVKQLKAEEKARAAIAKAKGGR